MTSKPIELDEERVLWFRARRTHLAGPGGDDARAAARRVLGAQSQQLRPSLHALCLRSAARETTRTLEARLVGDARDLVRTWGQRETVHVYAVEDWPLVVAARAEWAPPARPGPRLEPALVKAARRVLAASDGAITRDDLLPVVPRAYARELARHTGSEETGARAAPGD
ncbi:MAG: winged helix DNA-binding domain-containing protein [Planctomycetes bacterium]|nr:winged helix DNA-binding domain-containing protein [Planctomycetota bacterium]